MKSRDKTKEQYLNELGKMQKRISQLEKLEIEHKQAEEMLRESEKKYKFLVDNSKEIILILSKGGKILFVNKAALSSYGYSEKELIGKSIIHFLKKDSIKKALYALAQEFLGKLQPEMEVQVKTKSGEIRYLNVAKGSTFIREKGKLIGVMINATDITERKQAEETLKASLKEKEVLLQEIHHRVKNNMQIISSLLNIQSGYSKNKKVIEIFKKSRDRIRSMALIHEKLYQSKDLARINFTHYIQSLTDHLFHSYRVDPNFVRLKTDVEDVFLDINTAIPCGLIINELVSNSLKHAFPEGRQGKIVVRMYTDKKGKSTLIVRDNGLGFPEEFDFREIETLGMQLVNDLVKQINGKIEFNMSKGTEFIIVF